MEKAFTKVENLADSIKDYVNTRIESVKLQAAEKTSGVIANIIAGVVVAVVFLFFIVFSSIALSVGLGEWIGKPWAGYLMVAFLYLLIGIVVWAARVKMIRLPIMNALIQQLFENNEED
ncbi:MAG: phage holin family protein [Chitinophagaceae bacterium]